MKQKVTFRFAMFIGMAIITVSVIAYLQGEYPNMYEFIDQVIKSRIVPY